MIKSNNIRHYINNQDFGEPRDWQNLEIIIDFLNKKEDVNINITDLQFVRSANTFLQKRVFDGLTGGVGIFEGEPYKITIGDQSSPVYTFDGYLDFTDDTTVLGTEEFSCSLKQKQGTDWLNDVADSFSFAYLKEINIINDSDYIKVPYVINYVPDGMQLIILSMSLYMMTKELIENIQNLAETIADVTDAATPVIGVGVGFGAVAVTAWDLGNFILVVLKALARIAYIIAIIIAITNLIEQIFEQILPKKRNHLGMSVKRMFERGCQHLGLTLKSNLLNELSDWVHIPRKDKKGGEDGESGHPTNSGPIYTFGDLVRTFKELLNADFRVSRGVFEFERRDFFETNGTYKLPNYFNNQERMLDGFKVNADEMISNYNINWQYDVQDQNTLDNQDGRVFQAITKPITVINPEFVSIKNLAEISIPFSLGVDKKELSSVEKTARDLGRFVDSITGIFGGGTSFGSQITNRIGSLNLSSHFLTYGKIVVMSGGKLVKDQRSILASSNLYNNYHFINSHAEVNNRHNQYYRYLDVEVPMTLEDFEKLLKNNTGLDDSGLRFVIEKMTYKPHDRKAVIDYRINKKYTNNLKLEYV